jgi:hypothetical protein
VTESAAGEPPGTGWRAKSSSGEWITFESSEDHVGPASDPLANGDKEVAVELTDDERLMLITGLNDWGGPAHATDSLAVAMGFTGVQDLTQQTSRILARLQADQPLTIRDWSRALFATELIFASDMLGTGSEWTVIHGGDDGEWIHVLRRLQSNIPASRAFLGP